MAKLEYWVAPCESDHPCYSLVSKTRKGLTEIAAYHGLDLADFGKPEHRVIHYTDAFDLFAQCTGEGGDRLLGILLPSR
jgi:hypothetical protein